MKDLANSAKISPSFRFRTFIQKVGRPPDPGGILLTEQQALDASRLAGFSITFNDCGCDARVAFGGLELSWHPGQKTLEHQLFFHADNAVVGAAHADIGLVSCASGKNTVVCCGNVRMGADDG